MVEPQVKVEMPTTEESVKVSETENNEVETINEKPKRKINKIETVD